MAIWWPLGVREKHGVTVDDGRLVATYGRLHLETPRANVVGAHTTTGYRWWTAVGARLSFVDDGLTFGTNNRSGVCIHFAERVPKVIGFKPHSALTVTIQDCDGLVDLLGEAEPR
ncbi:MAG: hypothetical protein GY929_13970 [Actinomycetia bacterium]|nr:hypothetical protein [Actinomycetes bacterium]